jgi:hypothetical protein
MIKPMTEASQASLRPNRLNYSLGLLWILLFLTTLGLLGWELHKEHHLEDVDRLKNSWNADMARLAKGGHLHKGLLNLKTYEYFAATEIEKDWVKDLRVPFELKSDGSYQLEVLFISQEDEGRRAVVVQMDLVDINTNNLIWELGRTYSLDSTLRMVFLRSLRPRSSTNESEGAHH